MSLYLHDAKYTLNLERDEIYDICCAIKNGLLKSIEEHYVNHFGSFEQLKNNNGHEKRMINMLEEFLGICGYLHIYRDFEATANKLFDEHNKNENH